MAASRAWMVVLCGMLATVCTGCALAWDGSGWLSAGGFGVGGWLVPIGLIAALIAIYAPMVAMSDRAEPWSILDAMGVTLLTAMGPVWLVVEPFLGWWMTEPARVLDQGAALDPTRRRLVLLDMLFDVSVDAPLAAAGLLGVLTVIGGAVALGLGGRLAPLRLPSGAPWGAVGLLLLAGLFTYAWAIGVSGGTTAQIANVAGPLNPRMLGLDYGRAGVVLMAQGVLAAWIVAQSVRAWRARRIAAGLVGPIVLVVFGSVQLPALFLNATGVWPWVALGVAQLSLLGGLAWGWVVRPMVGAPPRSTLWTGLSRGALGVWVAVCAFVGPMGFATLALLTVVVVPLIPNLADASVVDASADAALRLWTTVGGGALIAALAFGVIVVVAQFIRWWVNQVAPPPTEGELPARQPPQRLQIFGHRADGFDEVATDGMGDRQ